MNKRLFLIVLDSLGIGEQPDAVEFGDAGSHTLRAIASSARFFAPHLTELGLFNIEGQDYGPGTTAPRAAFARMTEQSAGKDTTIGHWEIAGIVSARPLPTFPGGFPPELVECLERRTGRRMLCNRPYSGTQVIADFGREHVETGALILYTSADSVLQIAAHEGIVPLEELYEACRIARETVDELGHCVGRIIARPFVGEYPVYTRTANRHDFSLPPPGRTMLDALKDNGLATIGVGKIGDIFCGRAISESLPIRDNNHGMELTLAKAGEDFCGLCFVNLVDFDMKYGHRNDVDGYAGAVTEFDRRLGELLPLLRPEDAVLITADHGCDPSTPSTDHSREYAPMLLYGAGIQGGVDLGTRFSFADIAATVQEYFGLAVETAGESFLQEVIFR